MAAATASSAGESTSHKRSRSHTNIPSRPTTPLRPPSRTSLRASQTTPSASYGASHNSTSKHAQDPLVALEPAFAELSDSMADLEANFLHLQLLNESLGRFNENFGAFLYGMNMSAFCVDFPEAPIAQSFARHGTRESTATSLGAESPYRTAMPASSGPSQGSGDPDATFLTTDTTFVENPPTSSKPSSKYSAPASTTSSRRGGASAGRGGSAVPATRGRGGTASSRGGSRLPSSGIARGASSVGRGVPRGRGVGRGVR